MARPPQSVAENNPTEIAPVRWGMLAVAGALGVAGILAYGWIERFGTERWEDNTGLRSALLLVILLAAGAATIITGATGWLDGRYPRFREQRLRFLETIRRPDHRTRLAIAIAVAVGSSAYFAYTAHDQGRAFGLRIHDENMYLVQAQQIGHGRLWMPAHACPDFFESFHIFARPVYAAMYFPGTALPYALVVRGGLPTWPLSLAFAGLGVALVYWLLTELTDGGAGLLGAFMMLGLQQYRYTSLMVMSHPLLMVQGLLLLITTLYWTRTRRARWLVLMGACAGWMAITRPLDAVCYALPVAGMFIWTLRRDSWRTRIRAVLIAVASASPLLAIQLVMNFGITGSLLKSPVTLYLQTYWPEMQARLGGRPTVIPDLPARHLPQFKGFYADFILPAVRSHQEQPTGRLARTRLETMIRGSLSVTLLAVPAMIGLAGLRERRRWLFWLPLPLFALAYLSFPFFFQHYVIVVAPLGIMTCLLGIDVVHRAAGRLGPAVGTFGAITLVALTVKMLPESNITYGETPEGKIVIMQRMIDQPEPMETLQDVNAQLARLPQAESAVVIFTFHPEAAESWRQEPVYTLDAPFPDDARIVRAHDLGDVRNRELFAYYAARQPNRRVYRYDLVSRQLKPLGLVTELAARP